MTAQVSAVVDAQDPFSKPRPLKVCVVLPAYYAAKTLEATLKRLRMTSDPEVI